MKVNLIFVVIVVAVVFVFSDGVVGDKGYWTELKLLGSKIDAFLCLFKWIWLLTVGFSPKETFNCPDVGDMRIFLPEKLFLNHTPVIVDVVAVPMGCWRKTND